MSKYLTTQTVFNSEQVSGQYIDFKKEGIVHRGWEIYELQDTFIAVSRNFKIEFITTKCIESGDVEILKIY